MFQINFDNFYFYILTDFQNIFRFFNTGFSNFRNMDQSFNFIGKFYDSAKRQEPLYSTFYNHTFFKSNCFSQPRVFLSSFYTESYASVFTVNFFHKYSYFIINFSSIFCFYITIPG